MKVWQVFKVLEEGYKIRRKSWNEGDYIQLINGRIVDKNKRICPIQFRFLHTDWEVIK